MDNRARQLARLVDELTFATHARRADWKPAGPAMTYRLERPSGTVILGKQQRVGSTYTLEFFNADGDQVMSHQEDPAVGLLATGDAGPRRGALQALYELVEDAVEKPRPEVDSFLREL